MQVGEIAEQTGASVRAIRYYEQAGLLPAVRRSNGYRDFEPSTVERVRVIRDLLDTGFTLAEIRSLWPCLESASNDMRCCVQTMALYQEKLDRIEAQMRTLTDLQQRIEQRMALLEPC